MSSIAVVGAGIVGVSTAVNIQKKLPSAKVRLISEKFSQDTTSWGAGGLFRPTTKHIKGMEINRLRKWVRDVWEFFSTLATSELAGETGMQIVSGYILGNDEPEGRLYEEFVYSHRQMSRDEMDRLNFKQYKYGYEVKTIITTVKKYYPWLLKQFQESGGEIEQRRVESLEEFVGKYDVVVNCTGLGSQDVVGDMSSYPVRGQLVRVRAPWIKHFVYDDDENTYLIPNEDILVLGGCRQRGNYNLNNTMEDTESILRRCNKLVPAIKGAVIDNIWTGLRPTRIPPRVEKETMHFKNGQLKLVHNYGHGANGIILSWGSSKEAADLVAGYIRSTSRL